MAQVELSDRAAADLERLIRTHSLPKDTKVRVRRRLSPLGQFPEMGPRLTGERHNFRFVLGPWRWMILVYAYLEDEDRVVVTTIQDARRHPPTDAPARTK